MSGTRRVPSAHVGTIAPRVNAEFILRLTPFDQRSYRKLIVARGETIRQVVERLRLVVQMETAVDAGCGLGFFSKTLADTGLNVCGFDGREENITEARKRFPRLPFETADIEDLNVREVGRFDFALCFGLLYHLENPFRAIRNLRALTNKCLLLESMCVPDERPAMLLREEPRAEDQSLTNMACYPSEGSLVKMLYRAGFSAVYRVIPLPQHDDFRETPEHKRKRTVLLATSMPVDVAGFCLYPEPREAHDPWNKIVVEEATIQQRVVRFLRNPARRQYLSLAMRARSVFPQMPIPWRLPFGAWWLAERGALDHELIYHGFEETEVRFVERFLRPGMTVLDIGAHHGLYTLLASKCVGRSGKVISFEPSPREFRRLSKHVRVNRCRNVKTEACALGNDHGDADLFVVDGDRDWGNSLRPPDVPEPTRKVRVPLRKLDGLLAARRIEKVDFIKLDVEGGELAVLKGASRLLQTAPRPAILAEVQDIRTRPWGYAARDILQLLARWNYRWFAMSEIGTLYPVSLDNDSYDANLVGFPQERVEEFRSLLEDVPSGDSEPAL